MALVDWNDPCARAAELRAAYYRLVSGQQETSVRYQGNGVERETRYQSIDLSALLSEIRTAEAECAGVTEEMAPRRRYAIQGGSRRAYAGVVIATKRDT